MLILWGLGRISDKNNHTDNLGQGTLDKSMK